MFDTSICSPEIVENDIIKQHDSVLVSEVFLKLLIGAIIKVLEE